jgi:S1-C subfamily serine protease
LLLSTLIFTTLAVLVVVFSVNKSSDVKRDTSKLPTVPATRATPVGAPVLTIVASNLAGTAVSQGSGFILSSDGLAGSNYHVIKGATEAIAECCNGRVFEIRSVEGADLEKDLVVFQLYERGRTDKPQNLPYVTLGSSKDLSVGDKVIAVGSPQGLENTISDGILSAVREYKSIRYLQITAPISPGSSGGPVLNDSGRMVGIATFQFEKGQNLNFAVDADHIRPLLDQHFGISLAEFQSVVRGSQRPQSSVTTRNTETVAAPNSSQIATPNSTETVEEPSFTGAFGGIVHNTSANVSAEFAITVRDVDGALSGCMGVAAPLFGSGPLAGLASGDDMSFTVKSPIGKITFKGHRTNESISGSYWVEHEDRPNEEGTFTLQKAKTQGPSENFNPAKCPSDAEIHQ